MLKYLPILALIYGIIDSFFYKGIKRIVNPKGVAVKHAEKKKKPYPNNEKITRTKVNGIVRLSFGLIIVIIFTARLNLSWYNEPMLERVNDEDKSNKPYKVAIQNYIENNDIPSLVIGIVDESGSQIYTYGYKTNRDFLRNEKVNEKTLYEIGSISKVFTGMMLADAILTDSIVENQPINTLLPEEIYKNKELYKQITLENLATHTSSLPRVISNPRDIIINISAGLLGTNPYYKFTEKRIFDYMETMEVTSEIG
ncbi:serine hydrolase [Clostridium sp. D2Q-11]|uniref:Beta-lactamase n=1 Tax=Anaeromonas frigoriresistens TaxID=2683708 RepID=A0A942UXN8_9FIRM|nr:serine hydrolase [Anaeromonas frigoriresistens]